MTWNCFFLSPQVSSEGSYDSTYKSREQNDFPIAENIEENTKTIDHFFKKIDQ